jgi:cytochrome oxidase Cu insertion factor (SCO1/SenC/PrrC family)
MLYFGFTFCPDICPTELTKITKVITTMGTIFTSSDTLTIKNSNNFYHV